MPDSLHGERILLEKIVERDLPSGLKVLFMPFEREKVVAVYLCVRVGSKYEWDEVAGITHLIEHMIFKGGEGQKPGEVAGKVEAKGGYINAFTSYDKTCYYVVGPKEVLETALEVLSQAVFKPYFDPLELEKEKEVIVEEMKMRLDNPMIVLFEELMKTSYTQYPYKRPIIGYEQTVRKIKREDLFYFIDRFYTPENMILTITGAIDLRELEPLLERYFAKLPARKLKKVSFPAEPYVSEPKLAWVERPVKESYFALSFPAPSIRDDNAPLMDLLAEILGGGESSRLYLRLKRELSLVKNISATAFTPEGPGLFEVLGTADPQNFHKILQEVLKEIDKFKKEGPSKRELEKAKIQVLSSFIFTQETAEGLSRQIANFQLSRGSYRDILWYKEKIEKATEDELRTLAEKWLDPQKLVAVFLSERALFSEEEYKNLVLSGKVHPKVETFTLGNGLKVILFPRRDIPTVGISLVFPGGVRFEREDRNGLFQALTLLWTRGTERHSAEEIAEKLESLGASIKGFTGRNTFGLKALTLSSKLDETLELFREILLYPSFSEEEIEKAKPELLSLLHQQEDQPLALALKEFLQNFFPHHPYGLNQAGSREFYLALNSTILKDAYKEFVTPDRGVLVITGDFDSRYLKNKIRSLFRTWDTQKRQTIKEPAPTQPKDPIKRTKKETFQTQILLGFQVPGLLSKERVTLEILNSALSGQDGRLFRILRDERSLAYAVTSFLVLYPQKSALIFYIGCSPEKEKQAIDGFFEILSSIKTEGLTEAELDRAKKRVLGRQRLALQSNLAKAEDMAINEVLGLGWNFFELYENLVEKTSSEDLKNLIERYLNKEQAFLLILGR
ncbi:MAG: insulinase family protein [Caldimicrobium sp.]|nr:insulinase family protein [Caldimicrobium sp.]MCX7872975.1 insulinase family protein [Caldimicrobium sp.]MDW8094594.1 pitrilysin family protein [Caldimicrobium sp.]